MLDLHKKYDRNVMIMMSQLSASSFRWEKSLCMCSTVMPTHLCIHRCLQPIPPMSLHELLSKFDIPPMAVILSHMYSGEPLYWSL